MERYESKSNFLEKFLKTFTEEDLNTFITKAEFYRRFIDWSKENNHREMSETTVGTTMKALGIDSGKQNFSWMNDGKGGQARVWLGIKWKE
jgi:phage/plasmid-associated DNA primase